MRLQLRAAAGRQARPGEALGDAVVRLLVVRPNGRRVLRAVSGDWPEILVDADNETGIRGVVVFRGRAV